MLRPCSGPFWLLLIVVCVCVLMGARAVAIRSRDGRLLEKSISGQKWPGTPCVIDYKSKYSIPGLFFLVYEFSIGQAQLDMDEC